MATEELLLTSQVVEIVSKRLAVSQRHAQERVMKRSDFPKPVRQVGRRALYSRQPIMKWLGLK